MSKTDKKTESKKNDAIAAAKKKLRQLQEEKKALKKEAKEEKVEKKPKKEETKKAVEVLKKKKSEESSIYGAKDQQKLKSMGIEGVQVNDPEVNGERSYSVRVGKRGLMVTVSDKEEARFFGLNLYAHINEMAEKLAKEMNEE